MKLCKKCLASKDISQFGIDKSKKDKLTIYCKDCLKQIREENKGKYSFDKEYYKNVNQERKDYLKSYYQENKEKIKLNKKEYQENNKEKLKEYRREYKKTKKQNDKLFKLKLDVSKLILQTLKNNGYSKNTKTYDILGCSFEDFKLHLESQFESWMNWDNKGKYNGELNYGWDIDHVIPVSSAKTQEEIIKLNHYTNLQPLCSYTNRVIKRDNF